MNIHEAQRALNAAGHKPLDVDGKTGAKTRDAISAFQKAHGLEVTAVLNPETTAALDIVLAGLSVSAGIVPSDWMPAAKMDRIIFHWTAGAHKASGLDRAHYHILIEADGKLVRGIPTIAANAAGGKGFRASHTLNCNTGSIGLSLCCMAGAVEAPFDSGLAPMTRAQWDKLAPVVADLCRRYSIPITPRTVLSHAEVQGTLGIKQFGKWDIARLAFDPSVKGATACGDMLRTAAMRL